MQGKADVCCVLCATGEVLGRALPTWVPQEWCWEWAGRKPLLSLGFNGCCCCLRGRKGISSWFHPSFCLVNNQNLQKKGKRGEVSLNLTLNSKFKYFNSLVRASFIPAKAPSSLSSTCPLAPTVRDAFEPNTQCLLHQHELWIHWVLSPRKTHWSFSWDVLSNDSIQGCVPER